MADDLGDLQLRCSVCRSHLEMGERQRVYCPSCQPGQTAFRLHHDDDCSAALGVLWHPNGYGPYCAACRLAPGMQSVVLVPNG